MRITVSLLVEIPASADINEIEQDIQEAGRQAMREATQKAVRAAEELRKTCPYCGSEAVRSEGTDQRIILTKFGRVVLPLRRLRCQACRRRFRPAEACLKSLQGGNVTAALSAACSEAGASFPYVTAAQVVNDVCGAQMSPEHVRRLTNRAGSEEAARQATEAKAIVEPTAAQLRKQRESESWRGAKKKQEPPAVLLVGLDGGWIKSREQKRGMEGKVGVIVSEMEALGKRGRRRMTSRRYVATFEPASLLGTLSYAATCQLQAEEAPTQVVVGDGAEWIKTQADVHFPQAVKILDWPHLWRKIHAAIRAVRPGQSKSAREFRKGQYEVLAPLLWQGQVDAALAQLQALRPGANQEPIDPLEEAISYLDKQRDWIGTYQQWQEAGYPVGSGLVERGVAVVINPRMKRRGMRWRRVNATAVVALRVRLLNVAWEKASAKRRAAA